MEQLDSKYDNLRDKLDILGYTQSLPLSAVPLVGVLFEDLIKTTESLRNAKLEVAKYLEEKHCWELGVEPYKCDNSRLLSECNAIHLQLIKTQDEFEEKLCDYRQKIRNLEADKQHLEEHCAQLEKNVRNLLMKTSGGSKSSKNNVNMSRKPFVSAVKSGTFVANPSEPVHAYRCGKCCSVVWTKHLDGKVQELHILQNGIQTQADQITSLKERLERRDREITRLNNLLSGGRPVEALAKDCCYKNIGTLSEDVEDLQREKVELVKKHRDAQSAMHEAMKRAIDLEQKNRQLEHELEEFQEKALSVESEANSELAKKENEICALKKSLEKSRNQDKDSGKLSEEKRRLHDQLNAITLREKELANELERLKKKNTKLKQKMTQTHKDSAETNSVPPSIAHQEEEIKRIRNERDFFQKEYLKLVEQSTSTKDYQMLKSQLESKDAELTNLTKEIIQLRYQSSRIPEDSSKTPYAVQAAIMRVERERDILKEELHLLVGERDQLRQQLENVHETQLMERCRIEESNQLLHAKIAKLETEKRELMAQHIPERTQLTLIKEELEQMRRRVQEVQSENHKLSTTNSQLRILQDQTEKALIDHQTKLLAAETNLENAESQLNTISTTRENVLGEANRLQREISLLKSNYSLLEVEKDKLMTELDAKTEKVYELENSLKEMKRDNQDSQGKIKSLEKALSETLNQKQEFQSELHETSTERKSMRDKIDALRLAHGQQLAENRRLSDNLAEVTAELRQYKQKLKDSEKEVDRLKQQLQQYVQEVKRVEELLTSKEQERDEMLEQYRSLSHDAVQLEGSNQCLENEAVEYKQQLCEAQTELCGLKKQLMAKDECISKFEKQVSVLSSQIVETQSELDQNYDDLRLTRVDLEASKELISKLDVQRDKLNEELTESKNIRCQLEKEIKELQDRLMHVDSQGRSNVGSLENQLSTTRKELEMHRNRTSSLNQEIMKLKKTIKELEEKIQAERTKCQQNETLAREYSVKIQELQQTLTNTRFNEGRSQEDSARSYNVKMDKCKNWKEDSASVLLSSFDGIGKNLTTNEKESFKRLLRDFLESQSNVNTANHMKPELRLTKLDLLKRKLRDKNRFDPRVTQGRCSSAPSTPRKWPYERNARDEYTMAFHMPMTPRSLSPRVNGVVVNSLDKTARSTSPRRFKSPSRSFSQQKQIKKFSSPKMNATSDKKPICNALNENNSNQNQCLKENLNNSVIPIPQKIPTVELIDDKTPTTSKKLRWMESDKRPNDAVEQSPHDFNSQPCNGCTSISKPIQDLKNSCTEVCSNSDPNITIDTQTTCACCPCMSMKKDRIMDMCKIASNEVNDDITDIYCRKSNMCYTPRECSTGASSCTEDFNSSQELQSSSRRRKKFDLSKLPPPPSVYCKF